MMEQELTGASASQTGPLDEPSPSVSALRASVPSADSLTNLDDLHAAKMRVFELRKEVGEILSEYEARRLQLIFEENVKAEHPWLGKAVSRTKRQRLRQSIWSREPVKYRETTERGVVTRQGPSRGYYRGYAPSPGEVFVLSKSGATAYELERGGWELEKPTPTPSA